jgi:PAS domain S-box-containing protein
MVVGIGLLVLLLIFGAGLSAWNTRQISKNNALVTHSNTVLDAMDHLLAALTKAESNQRGFLITADEIYLKPYRSAIESVAEDIRSIKSLTEDNSRQQARLPELQKCIDAKIQQMENTIELRKSDPEAARKEVLLHLGKNLMDDVRDKLDEMEKEERDLLSIRERESSSSYAIALTTDFLSAIFGLGMLTVAVSMLYRYLHTRAKAAAEIHEQREWFRTTVESIGDGVIATDIGGRVQILNRVAQEMTGWSEADAIGKSLEDVFPIVNEKTREKCENPVAKVLQTGKIVGLANHTALIAKDGTEKSIADSAAPIRNPGGRITGVVLVFRDVTEQKRMEDALARLASFPTLNPSPVMETDFEGKIHYLNPATRTLFPDLSQLERNHPWLADWQSFVLPLREDGLRTLSREVMIGERCFQQTVNYIRETERIRIYGMEITQRKRAEEQQALDRANLQSIFDAVNVGMLLIDEHGSVRRVNDTVTRWFGKESDTRLGVQPGDLVGCLHAISQPSGCGHTEYCLTCPIRNTFESVFRTGEPIHDVEAEAHVLLGGKPVELWLEASADPILMDGRKHVVLALNNITSRKLVEKSLQQTADELARSNRDLEQFAYVASHDLQEPLRMVAGYLQLLEERYKGQLDEKADKFIDYAVDGSERMSSMIRDLLAYSRVNARQENLDEVDANAAFSVALQNLGASVKESSAVVTRDELPTIRGDSMQLAMVFQNLIGNAIKFRIADRDPKIHVSAKKESNHWIFEVKDNGIGFEQQYEDKIYMIFQRLHGHGHYPGTGIGLAICKRIIERHGGKIWATSAPGEGSTFFFTVPL